MSETRLVSKKDNVLQLQELCSSKGVTEKCNAIFKNEAKTGQFLASVITAVRLNSQLQECNPTLVVEQALIAASVNLNINGTLGEAAIIPFKTKDGNYLPQLQIQTKGITQLCLRSGQFSAINVYCLYKDEYLGKNLITGEIKYQEVPNGDRTNGREENVAGWGCYFRLNTGFEKNEFWTVEELEAHGKKYSSAYRTDLAKGWTNSLWSTNKPAMYSKTVLKNTLNKWGIKSVEMAIAFDADQNTGTVNGRYKYDDNTPDLPSYDEDEMATRNDLLCILKEKGFDEEAIKTYYKVDHISLVPTDELTKRVNIVTNNGKS